MFTEFIDISRTLRKGMKVFPGDPPFVMEQQMFTAKGELCNLNSIALSLHCGTHIDAPLHFLTDGAAIAQLSLELFFGKARVVTIDSRKPLGAQDLAAAPIVPGERVLINIPVNEQTEAMPEIGLLVDAAEYLIAQKVALVGINCGSIEQKLGEPGGVHYRLLAAGIPVLENLVLAGVQPGEYYLACFPLKVEAGDGSPVRAVLLR
ncbi:MAG TPA: cyclase family protein [Bacillota bacterium]|nr:cyclase family protein [Bacillota bacterium]